jgi:hypothetical protein
MSGMCCKLKLGNTILPRILLHQCVPMHSKFQPPIWLQLFFFVARLDFCSFFPSSSLFCLHIVILFTPRRQTNERMSKRTNERYLSPSHVMFIFCYPLLNFAFCVVPLSFGTRSATTMTTAIEMTKMLMVTQSLLHVAQKGSF